MWARCWLQRHLNSQQAACHSHITGKSPSSFHFSHRCPISQTEFGYITVMSELLGCFFLLLLTGASTPCWTFSLHDYMAPCECGCRAQFCPSSLSMNQHSHQVHLACLSLLSLHLGPAGTLGCPASWGEAVHEQCGPNVHVHLCPSQA